jgi:CheY-like chemotaxis protein
MQSLFNPFKQTQRLAGGTGLGLYSLAKRVEALNGQYGVKKRKDGMKGSLFWFSIPYKADIITASSVEQQTIKNSVRDSFLIPTTRNMIIPTRLMSSDELMDRAALVPMPIANEPILHEENLHILLAEDSHTIAKMTSMILKRQGYKVTVAENGELALQLIMDSYNANGKVKYDVVLMDLQMPVMDGLEATRRLRQIEEENHAQHSNNLSIASHTTALSPKNSSPLARKFSNLFPHVLVIGVSANSDDETMEEAYQAGIDAFIAKPFAIDTFTETFHNLIFR